MSHKQPKNPASPPTFSLSHPLGLVGTATSDWQMNPRHDASEWGEEVRRALKGERTGIRIPFMGKDLPSFDTHWRTIVRRAAEAGGNTFRMSFDFAELCPQPGVFRGDLISHYIRVLAECRRLGLVPVVTLHHWTHPKSFGVYDKWGRLRKSPLEHPGIMSHFRFYVEHVAEALYDPATIREALRGAFDDDFVERVATGKPLCDWFVTLNEPMCMTVFPYVLGHFPPYKHGRILTALRLERKLRDMHGIMHRTFHEAARKRGIPDARAPRLGMAHGVVGSLLPVLNHVAGWGMVERMERGQESDFLGIQYYTREKLAFRPDWPPVSLAGFDPRMWSDAPAMEVYPPGIRDVLHRAHRLFPHLPLFLTEFGFADRSDRKRPAWLLESVVHAIRAAEEGVPLVGMLLWTLTDNFEWHHSMGIRFGLLDKDGGRLETDTGLHLSSREVWAACAAHLRHPTPEGVLKLEAMRKQAWEQLEDVVREEEVVKSILPAPKPGAWAV